MVGSVNNGYQQQLPASKAFEPGQAPNNPANTPKVNDAPQAATSQPATVSAGKTEEINQKLALSRDNTRPDPSQVSNNSQQRGASLDISV